MPAPPVALTIAGSDCSSGAGIQADLKAFSAAGIYGLTAVTSVISEVPGQVAQIQPMPAEMVRSQVQVLQTSFPIAAAKTGLLATAEIVDELRELLQTHPWPLVVDPVAVASTGTSLVGPGFREAMAQFIPRCATLVTPNRGEAEELLGTAINSPEHAAEKLADRYGCAVLLKGGHFDGTHSIDYLAHDSGVEPISRERLPIGEIHGTGCTYSAAITAQLARGLQLAEAVHAARDYLQESLKNALSWADEGGKSVKALEHFPKSGHQ